jgi:hypothetical protein
MILNHGTWQGGWVSLIHRPLYPWVHIEQKVGWIPEPLFALWGKIMLLSLLGKKLRFLGRPIRSLVAILYEVSWLRQSYK